MTSEEVNALTGVSKPETKRPTLLASFSALFSSFTGLFMYGFSIGSINAASIPVKEAITHHYEYRYNSTVDETKVDNLWVLIGAAFPIGGIVGVMFLNSLSKRFDRVTIMICGHIIASLSGGLVAVTDLLKSPEILIIFRFLIGTISSCVGTGITPMYLIEVVPKAWRGFFGSTVTLFISFGLFVANVIGLPQILGNQNNWPYFLAITSIPSVLFVLSSKWIVKSPRYLYMKHKNEEELEKALIYLRGTDDVQVEKDEMIREVLNMQHANPISVMKILGSKVFRWQLVSAIVLGCGQQLTGLNGVSYQLNDIFLNAGIEKELTPYYSIAITGLSMCLATTSTILVRYKGRKTLLMTGYIGEGFCLLILAMSILLQNTVKIFAYVSCVGAFGYFVAFNLGPAPCTFLAMSEFFDQSSRSAGMTVSITSVWISFSLIVIITPYMLTAIGGYAFIPYAVIAFLSALYIFYFVPETRNKSFTEIQQRFSMRSLRSFNRDAHADNLESVT